MLIHAYEDYGRVDVWTCAFKVFRCIRKKDKSADVVAAND